MVMLDHQLIYDLLLMFNFWESGNGWFNGWTPGKDVVWAFGKPNGCTPGGINGWTPSGVKGWTLFLTLNKRENRMKNQFN